MPLSRMFSPGIRRRMAWHLGETVVLGQWARLPRSQRRHLEKVQGIMCIYKCLQRRSRGYGVVRCFARRSTGNDLNRCFTRRSSCARLGRYTSVLHNTSGAPPEDSTLSPQDALSSVATWNNNSLTTRLWSTAGRRVRPQNQ